MSKRTCQSCAHWTMHTTPSGRVPCTGVCKSADVYDRVTVDDWGEFDTTADFGCLWWTKREAKT